MEEEEGEGCSQGTLTLLCLDFKLILWPIFVIIIGFNKKFVIFIADILQLCECLGNQRSRVYTFSVNEH